MSNWKSVSAMWRLCLTIALLSSANVISAAEPQAKHAPLFEQVDIFEAGHDNYALYRIPGMVVTAKGTVLAYCEARRTGKSDWDEINIMLRRSSDGGKTWDQQRVVSHYNGKFVKNPVALAQKLGKPDDRTFNNAVAFAEKSGKVHFLYCLDYFRCYAMHSDDDGVSWSEPVEITSAFEEFKPEYDWKVIATGPTHGIELQSGRLIVPVWMSTGTGNHAHRPSITSVIYSDDHGTSWHRGEIALQNTEVLVDPNEACMVELNDGSVLLNARSESKANRRLITSSPNGISQWSTPKFADNLLEPICMASLLKWNSVTVDGKHPIVFANPDNLTRADGKTAPGLVYDRKNVSVKVSFDDGITWKINKVIEPSFSAYTDMACLPDGTLLLFYERGSIDGKAIYKTKFLSVARMNLEWLQQSKE
jgi:sialidase-1